MGWSDSQKTVMSEGLFVSCFVHGPQILSFPSAQTHGGSDFFTAPPPHGESILPVFPYPGPSPNFTPQRDCPQRLCLALVWLCPRGRRWSGQVGVLDLLGSLCPLT